MPDNATLSVCMPDNATFSVCMPDNATLGNIRSLTLPLLALPALLVMGATCFVASQQGWIERKATAHA
jgi:hypothetical protein